MPSKDSSIYLFLGEEDFLKEEAVEKLKSMFLDVKTKELNYSVFYAKEKNFNIKGLLECLNTLPFIAKKRLVLLKDADSLAIDDKKSILCYLHSPRESSVFVIEDSLSGIKGEFILEASQLAQLSYFRKVTDSGIETCLIKKAAQAGKKMQTDAARAIKEAVPNDLRTLYSNLDNIILYVGKNALIAKEDVEKVIGVNPSHTAFDLIDSMGAKDAKKALRIFASLKRDRKKEIELLGLLAWNTRMLFRIKELLKIKSKIEAQRDMGLYPKKFEQIAQQAVKFKDSHVSALLNEIIKADLDIKTGMEPGVVMERVIVKMCSN